MNYLDNINSPKDLRKLSVEELKVLSQELREYTIEVVSKTGGHLASNLGIVELTIALHYALNTPEDKIIWDVGHQSYIHKILTGRKNQMPTLRQLNGLSGFPKRNESIYDSFDTGHSSTSISAAMGMARGRDLKKENYEVVAVIGDGAMTGGMAFEALNDAGRSNTKLMIVLNDNEMSISQNVGGMSKYLGRLRAEERYLSTKKDVEKLLNGLPLGGKTLRSFLKRFKNGIKKVVVPGMLFEELGLTYMGPIDGHNIDELLEAFKLAKNIEGPIIMHVITKKGKGYKFAEERPNEFHGVSPFNVTTGENLKKSMSSYSDVFGNKLCEIAGKNDTVVAITAAMTDGTGLTEFANKYPKRLFDAGIAEQHAVTMAAGLAVNGIVPVVALYSSFIQRAYDQVVHDVALQNLHVVFAIDRAGLVGNDGETHQGVFDEGFLMQIPNMTIMAPVDYREFNNMIEYAVNEYDGPIALRYPRGSSVENINNSNIKIEKGKGVVAAEGKDVTIIAWGKMVTLALEAREILKAYNIDAEVLNLRFTKPCDKELILKSINKTNKAVIINEACSNGTSLIIKDIIPNNVEVMVKGLPDKFIRHGSIEELLKENKLDAKSIAEDIAQWRNK